LTVVPTNSASGYTGVSDAPEAYLAKNKVFNLYHPAEISGVVDLPQLNGKSKVAYAADDTTQALVTASPSETMTLHVVGIHMDGSTNLAAYVFVQLKFQVEFSDPVELAQS
jgi:hypothetical protein